MATFSSVDMVRADTAAQLKAWVQLTHDAMLAVGCVQTEDTGQLDIEGIGEPTPNISYTLGYRVYELNDSLSSTHPVYIRIDFSPRRFTNQNTQAAAVCTICRVGFATNGAGSLVGPVLNNYYTYASNGTASSATIAHNSAPLSFACKLDGYLAVGIGLGAGKHNTTLNYATASLFAVKRGRNSDGSLDGDRVVVFSPGASGASSIGSYPDVSYQWGIRSPSMVGAMLSPAFGAPAVGVVNGLVRATPAVICYDDIEVVDPDIVAVPLAAVTKGGLISLSQDGVNEITYLVLPGATSNSAADSAGSPCWTPDSRNRYGYTVALRFQ
ncbi:hypothetical protein ACNJYG_06605 [Pseudomonas sp. GW6]